MLLQRSLAIALKGTTTKDKGINFKRFY